MKRRKYLASMCLGLTGIYAGCVESGEIATEAGGGENEPDSETPTERQTPTETPTPSSRTFELGEEAVYQAGEDIELVFRPTEALLRDALVSSRSNQITSRTPENSDAVFLTIGVGIRNTGDQPIRPPSDISFILDGQQYELKPFAVDGLEAYSSLNQIRPGASTEGTVNFAIPPKDTEGRLVVDFGRFGNTVAAEWTIDLSNLERESFDWRGLEVGQNVTMGAGNTWYSIELSDYTETISYTYTGVTDTERTHEAAMDNKFVLVDLTAENTGETSVVVPTRFDMRLLSESSQFEPVQYRRENQQYEGGEIASGVVRDGKILFEVPHSASSFEFQVDLTGDIIASWSF